MAVTAANTEPYHLNRVRELYANGRLNSTQLERAIEHVLRGGYIDDTLTFRAPILDRVRARRQCSTEGHNPIDIASFDTPTSTICARCGKRGT